MRSLRSSIRHAASPRVTPKGHDSAAGRIIMEEEVSWFDLDAKAIAEASVPASQARIIFQCYPEFTVQVRPRAEACDLDGCSGEERGGGGGRGGRRCGPLSGKEEGRREAFYHGPALAVSSQNEAASTAGSDAKSEGR